MTKRKPTFIVIPLDIYRRHVVVAIGASLDDVVNYGLDFNIGEERFNDEWKKGFSDCLGDLCSGSCHNYGDGNSDILVHLKTYPTKASEFGVLYHELSHAVDLVAHQTDENSKWFADDGMSEPRAYLLEFMINACHTVLWK